MKAFLWRSGISQLRFHRPHSDGKKEGNRVNKDRISHTDSTRTHQTQTPDRNPRPALKVTAEKPSRSGEEESGSFVRRADNLPTWKRAPQSEPAHSNSLTPQPRPKPREHSHTHPLRHTRNGFLSVLTELCNDEQIIRGTNWRRSPRAESSSQAAC